MPAPYTMGETVTLQATVKDPTTNEPFNPSGIGFKVLAPNATSWTTVTPTQASTGVWTFEQIVNVTGQWWWRVETTGPTGAAERTFLVNASRFS